MQCSTAILFSGGLDSAILLDELSAPGRVGAGGVVPLYVACGSAWERAELAAARRFIAALDRPSIAPLVVLSMPTGDLYGLHWSLGNGAVPAADSADEAVFLPGRNALLAVKPLVWCGMHGVGELALATLAGNPFPDAGRECLDSLSRALSLAMATELRIVTPFAMSSKAEVMRRGAAGPLAETLSCIDPERDPAATTPDGPRFLHCGRCNKCAERHRAFADASLPDPTRYAGGLPARA